MKPLIRTVLLAALALFASLTAYADERILAYDSRIEVRKDGSLDVVETIRVRAEGQQIRRGIYRDFPTRYRDRYGNRVEVAFEIVGVTRNGVTEPWFTESLSNGVRVNTGNDDFLQVPAEHIFQIHYRTTRQMGFFADHDELYWNAIGTDWAFPIDAGGAEVLLPEPVPPPQLKAEGYTGAQGSKSSDLVTEITGPGSARYRLTRPLTPREGMTIVLSFPKGLVPEPDRSQRLRWLLADNLGVLIALSGLALLLIYAARRWHAVGRDPPPGVVIARYEPPGGHSPAGLRYLRRMGYDNRCFASDLLSLAVSGDVHIKQKKKKIINDEWHLKRIPGTSKALSVSQLELLGKLFAGGPRIELTNTNAATISGARTAHEAVLAKEYQPAMFARNLGSVRNAAGIGALSLLLAIRFGGGSGTALIIGIAVLMLVSLIVFAILIKAPTPAGRKLRDEIDGLRTYLRVAERDELASLSGPGNPPALDAKRYEHLLPFAVALDVEEAWTEKFTLAVGAAAAAAATANIGWYQGPGSTDLGSLSQAIGNSLSSQIASSSSPPGSSSGGGGGGSSGGGGGGGGGGGR